MINNKEKMDEKNDSNDSFKEIKIYKPKPKRLCPPKKKIKNSSSSSSSSSNSEKSPIQFDLEDIKMKLTNLDKISLEEINNDFLICEKNLEEEECQNELWNIMNNSSENYFSELNIHNNPKIKRCNNAYEEKNFEYLKECDIDELFNEFNDTIERNKK